MAEHAAQAGSDGRFLRLLRNVSPAAGFTAAGIEAQRHAHDRSGYRELIERGLLELTARRRSSVGRVRARCADARALHVRLDGPVERRIVQAMRIERVDEATARRRLPTPTARASARERCVRHLYGVDPADASLYAIVLDGTTLEPAGCPEVVAAAVAHRGRDT